MTFTKAPPIIKVREGTGISCSLRYSKAGIGSFKIYINAPVQERVWGKRVGGQRCNVMVGRGSDEGLLRIELAKDGEFEFREFMKGSVALSTGAWDLLPKSARPSVQVKIKYFGDGVLDVVLPSWAHPSGHDGKLAEEHGIKGGAAPKGKTGRLKAQASAMSRAVK